MTRVLAARSWAALAVLLVLFGALRLGEATAVIPGWLRWYGDDLLFMPLVLTAALAVQRRAGAGAGWVLPLRHGLAATVIVGGLFEGILPTLAGRGTADPVDLAAYLAGWVFFQTVVNRPAPEWPPCNSTPCGVGRSCRSSGKFTQPETVLQET